MQATIESNGRLESFDRCEIDVPLAGSRLNIGGGNVHITGFVNIDRKNGEEAYPLDRPDNSVEEILASHVLEHFSHREVADVLQNWVNKLRPGGKIRLAVPDFQMIARDYLAGEPINVQGYVMGGHCDADDHHGTLFDREALTELMICCGLERIGPWKSEMAACSSLPISLNLQGFKPIGPQTRLVGVKAALSAPRFGPLLHPQCKEQAFQQLGIEGKSVSSCFWHQAISNLMEEHIADPTCEFVLTLDFDTVFCAGDVLELYRLMQACPEIDAVFPLQSKRGCEQTLFSITDGNGNIKGALSTDDLGRNLLPANTGHFGLTLFRADSLRRFPRPWMVPQPNPDGRWEKNQRDADIDFWIRFKAAGFKCCLAPKVVVGHLEETIKWPGIDLAPVYQSIADYQETGIPAEVAR